MGGVFSRRLNPATLSDSRMALGKAFHTVGADKAHPFYGR